jgi:hypothetical protein
VKNISLHINNFFVIIFSVFVSGCIPDDGSGVSSAPDFLNNNSETIVEGTRYKVGFTRKAEMKEVLISVTSQKNVFLVSNGLNAELIAPNVDESITFQIQADITTIDNVKYTEFQTIIVEPVDMKLPSIQPEPNVFSGAVERYEGVFLDDNLVPMLTYEGELVYSPTYIATYAYNYYLQYYENKRDEDLLKFLNAAKWLKENCIYTDFGFCSFRFDFPVDGWSVSTDWTSAMAQGQALTSLIAAAYVTNDVSYSRVAYDALAAFQYPVELKGVSSYSKDTIWFEEYGSESFKSSVLNGFLFSMSGIRSFNKSYPQLGLSNSLFQLGIKALEVRLPSMDVGFTSFYNCSPELSIDLCLISSAKGSEDLDAYHELHVYQLGWLTNLTNSEIIKSYFSKFLSYDFGQFTGATKVVNSGLSNKFLNITASHTNAPETHGVNMLTDENWTYGSYWSSSRGSVYLDIELNNDFLDEKIVKKVVISSLTIDTMPDVMNVYYLDGFGVEQFVSTYNVKDIFEVRWDMQTANYPSVTLVIPVNENIESKNVRLYFEGGSTIAIRELNILYPRERLMELVKVVYKYQ